MARCNLLLSRSGEPAADVLVIGSSRAGVAIDPVAMQRMLAAETGRPFRVDRLALPRNPMRAMSGLLENYIDARGPPRVIVLEIMFMTEHSINRLARWGWVLAPENHLYRRDVDLLRFDQLLDQPSVAMPFTTGEGVLNLWSQRLRGTFLRAGALLYQAVRDPGLEWDLAACTRDDWRREDLWPTSFAFSYGEFEPAAGLPELVATLEAEVARTALARAPAPWQAQVSMGRVYPYDFAAAYRQGEVRLLDNMIERALERGSKVLLLPLPLYGYELDHAALTGFVSRFPQGVHLYDLFGDVRSDFDSLWFDDGHVERSPVAKLTTALLARHLLRLDD